MTSKMHHRNVYVLLLLIAVPLFSSGQNKASELFAKGNGFYAKTQYKQAADVYEQLLDSGFQSASVYFNLANANYKTDDIPSAILNYEKAHKLAPGDEDIQVNLQLANLKITDKIEAVPEFFIVKWWRGLMMIFSLQTWSVLSVAFFISGFLLLIVYLFSKVHIIKKSAFYSGIVVLALALTTLIVAHAQNSYFNNHQEAIVFSGTVNVKSAPDDDQKILFVIHEGTKVQISQQENGWMEIKLPNGNIGWIESSAVKVI